MVVVGVVLSLSVSSNILDCKLYYGESGILKLTSLSGDNYNYNPIISVQKVCRKLFVIPLN